MGWILSKLGTHVPKICFLLTALLLEPFAIGFTRVNSILKTKNGQKSYGIEIFGVLVVSMVIFP